VTDDFSRSVVGLKELQEHVRKKLTGPLFWYTYVCFDLNCIGQDFNHEVCLMVPAQVEKLIHQATSLENLTQGFSGWYDAPQCNLDSDFVYLVISALFYFKFAIIFLFIVDLICSETTCRYSIFLIVFSVGCLGFRTSETSSSIEKLSEKGT
jgi:hypothetical protein